MEILSSTCRKGQGRYESHWDYAAMVQPDNLPCCGRPLGYKGQADSKSMDILLVFLRVRCICLQRLAGGSRISGPKRCGSQLIISIISFPHDGSRRCEMHGSDLRLSRDSGWPLGDCIRNGNRSPLVSLEIASRLGRRADRVSICLFQAGISGKTNHCILHTGAGWKEGNAAFGFLSLFRADMCVFIEIPEHLM